MDQDRLVLVVEDDLSVRRPLAKFLDMHGFSVVTADTAEQGMAALKKHRVVAAVVDLRLRQGSGREVVASLRQVTISTTGPQGEVPVIPVGQSEEPPK